MGPDELLRRIGQNAAKQAETDRFGRPIPDRIQIEDALSGLLNLQPSNRSIRKEEKRLRRGIERG
jgi:hypothetical protein